MSNRIAKYLDPEGDKDSKRVIASVCYLMATEAIRDNFRASLWNDLPDHLKRDAQEIYKSFVGEKLSMTMSSGFYREFIASMNTMGDVVTARYNELKGSE